MDEGHNYVSTPLHTSIIYKTVVCVFIIILYLLAHTAFTVPAKDKMCTLYMDNDSKKKS